jgi:formate C-acetyltransferase
MFETFGWAGKAVAATPDGRRAGEPLGDSVGPVQGRDRRGPTAMLRSVARLPQAKAVGTPVLNLRLSKGTLLEPESRRAVRALIESYFAMGGMQVQISVLDKVELEDALAHPERHEDLIVRIGGYSAYFNRLSPELKQEVIRRTEYAV